MGAPTAAQLPPHPQGRLVPASPTVHGQHSVVRWFNGGGHRSRLTSHCSLLRECPERSSTAHISGWRWRGRGSCATACIMLRLIDRMQRWYARRGGSGPLSSAQATRLASIALNGLIGGPRLVSAPTKRRRARRGRAGCQRRKNAEPQPLPIPCLHTSHTCCQTHPQCLYSLSLLRVQWPKGTKHSPDLPTAGCV